MYSGFEVTFDSAGSWSFSNDSAANVITFGVDNSPSSHADNYKNNFLVLGEVQLLVQQRKSLVLILAKQAQSFAWDCIIMLIIVIYLFVTEKEIFLSLRPTIKMLTF